MEVQQAIDAAKGVQVVCSQASSQWIPVASTVIGAVIGGVSTYLATRGAEARKLKRQAETVEAAIVAEVQALLRIVELRQYVDHMKKAIDHLKSVAPGTTLSYQIQVDDGYNKVYVANLENLGLLDSDRAASIVEFYQLVQAVVSDVKPGGLIACGAAQPAFEQMLNITEAAIALGEPITSSRLSDGESRRTAEHSLHRIRASGAAKVQMSPRKCQSTHLHVPSSPGTRFDPSMSPDIKNRPRGRFFYAFLPIIPAILLPAAGTRTGPRRWCPAR